MASLHFGVNRGQQKKDIVSQASSPSKAIEVKIDKAAGLTKLEVLTQLDLIKQQILERTDW